MYRTETTVAIYSYTKLITV